MAYLNIVTKNTGDLVTSTEFNAIVTAIQDLQKGFGWATYFDTQYSEAIPQVINSTDGWTSIENNAGGKIENYLPYGVTSLYNELTNKLIPTIEGSTASGYVKFVARIDTLEGYIRFGIDIDGDQGIIFRNTYRFPRGANVWHTFTIPINAYVLDTFVTNGGIPKIEVSSGNEVELYGATFFFNIASTPL